jgi:hypothetical protein
LAKALRPALTAQQAVLPGVEGLFINFFAEFVLNMHEVKLPLPNLLQQEKTPNFVQKSDSYESQNTDIISLNSANR